jgi:PTS system mannose-specific IIA component
VLVLADLFGGSAANVALSQLGEDRVEVVTGANLAMVLEAATYAVRGVSLAELASRVADAARTSVVVAGHLITPIAAGGRTAA